MRKSAGMKWLDTLLILKDSVKNISASFGEGIGKDSLGQRSLHLPEPFYGKSLSMRIKRPILHSFVESAAVFLFVGMNPGVVPLRMSIPHMIVNTRLERNSTNEY